MYKDRQSLKFICISTSIMVLLINLVTFHAFAQKLVFSEPDRIDVRQTNFEIIGKYKENYLVFKNNKNGSYISVFDVNMKLVENVQMPYLPERLIEANFVAYPDYSYLFYQHYQKGIMYAKAVKIGPDGRNLTQPIELDTTYVGNASDKVYSIVPSDDKKQLVLFKINTRNQRRFIFKTLLFNADLSLKHMSPKIGLDIRDRNDFITDFSVDNEGNLVFGKGLRNNDDENITKFQLVVKPAEADSFMVRELPLEKVSLDEVKLKMDNYNNRYLFTAFYYPGRKKNIEGIANAIFDKKAGNWTLHNVIPLGEELRQDARGESNIKAALDDYYIHDITIRSDGAFLINAEALYTTSRGTANNFNRWNNIYNPNYSMYDYYRWGGYGPYGSMWGSGSNTIRYHAENVLVLAFDKEGKMILSNLLRKTQFDDNSEAMVSYSMINTGNGLHYLYNDYDKRDIILAYQTLTPQGKIIRNPTVKGMARDYSFLPRYAKQVGARVVVMPAIYRNTLCFARLEFP